MPISRPSLTPAQLAATRALVSKDGSQPIVWTDYPLLRKWRNALTKVRAGTGNAKLLFIGDSTTVGAQAGSGGTANINGAQRKNITRNVVSALCAQGIPAQHNSLIGNGRTDLAGATYDQYDSRIALGSFTPNSSTLGGQAFRATGAGSLAFTPSHAFDTIVVYYLQSGNVGTFNINVDGGATIGATVNSNGADALGSTSRTCTKGAKTINIAWATGTVWIAGIWAYDSTAFAVHAFQAGFYGGTAPNFANATNAYAALNCIDDYAPDLSIVNLTLNDISAGTTAAAYSTALQSIITACQASGDVVLVVANDYSGSTDPLGIKDVARALAQSNGCTLVDIGARWVSYTAANAFGWMGDSTHPNARGYAEIAAAYVSQIAVPGRVPALRGTPFAVAITSASTYTNNTNQPQTVSITGTGTFSAMTLTRNGSAVALPLVNSVVTLWPGDVLTPTYTDTPVFTVIEG